MRAILFAIMVMWCGVVNATNYCDAAVGCWLFTEGSGTTVDDSSPNSNTGTFKDVGEPTWDTTDVSFKISGSAPNSVDFDGSNDYINVNDDNVFSINNANAFSITAWDKGDVFNGSRRNVVSKGEVNKYEYMFGYENTSLQLKMFIFTNAGGSVASLGATSAIGVVGEWQHIAVTIDYGASKEMIIYFNGTPDGNTTTFSGTYGNNTANLRIGNRADSQNHFNGRITDVGVFNIELTSTQISQIYDFGLTGQQSTGTYSIIRNSIIRNSIIR